jgi:hypothetical protein
MRDGRLFHAMCAHRRSIGLEGRLTGCAVRVMGSWPGELRELLEVGQAGIRASSRLERGRWAPGTRDTSARRPAPIGWTPNQPRQPHTSAIGVTSSGSKRPAPPQAMQVRKRPARRPPSHLGIAQRRRIDRVDRIRITAAQLPLGGSPHARGNNGLVPFQDQMRVGSPHPCGDKAQPKDRGVLKRSSQLKKDASQATSRSKDVSIPRIEQDFRTKCGNYRRLKISEPKSRGLF